MNMKIDRHNYEEFFLLYVDNELTTGQKELVDQFVLQNPDLAIELEILQQTTFSADKSVVFDRKEMLIKREADAVINLNNYEEYLISYIDNELTDAERIAFLRFADSHAQVKEELAIYQQTKLQPEKEIVFENKQVLYRKEERVKVITIQWWKIAVAAAVILAAGITTVKVLTNNKSSITAPEVARTNDIKNEKNNTAAKADEGAKKEQNTNPANEQTIKDNTDNVASANDQKKKVKINAIQKTNEEKVQKKSLIPAIKENNESIAVNTPVKRSNEVKTDITVDAKTFDAIKKSDEPVKTNDVAINTLFSKENINTKPVTPATDEPLDNKETAQSNINDNAVYASYEEGKNKKLRGFFRKASRVFERRTNISAADEEEKQDKVLIGGLAVKLK